MRIITILTLWLHLIFAFALVGSSIFLAIILIPVQKTLGQEGYHNLARIEQRFVKLARRFMEVIIVTGILNVILYKTFYGLPLSRHFLGTVILKLILVIAIFLLYAKRVSYLTSIAGNASPSANTISSDFGADTQKRLQSATYLLFWQVILGIITILLGLSLSH